MALVKLAFDEDLCLVTLDNPPVNVLSLQMARDLRAALSDIAARTDVSAVIVTGAGSKAFVAGGDIREFPEFIANGTAKQAALEFDEVLQRLHQLPLPTIAAIGGHALGGGCELALACDFRIAEMQVRLGFPEITLGVLPGAGGTQRLPRLIGVARAKRMILSGQPVSAAEALQIGLVDEVVGQGEAIPAAKRFADLFRGKSRIALRLAKRAVDEGLEHTLAEGLALEAERFGEAFTSEDALEGVTAFMEKRAAQFRHR